MNSNGVMDKGEVRTTTDSHGNYKLFYLPAGTHVLILTHDHAEDFALCDAALRCAHLGPIGLIGSSVKWTRFRHKLAEEGHAAEAIDRITSPIGLPDLPGGKDPAAIAVSVAADLLRAFALESSRLPT